MTLHLKLAFKSFFDNLKREWTICFALVVTLNRFGSFTCLFLVD